MDKSYYSRNLDQYGWLGMEFNLASAMQVDSTVQSTAEGINLLIKGINSKMLVIIFLDTAEGVD